MKNCNSLQSLKIFWWGFRAAFERKTKLWWSQNIASLTCLVLFLKHVHQNCVYLACAASIPVWAEQNWRFSHLSSMKNGLTAKRSKEGRGLGVFSFFHPIFFTFLIFPQFVRGLLELFLPLFSHGQNAKMLLCVAWFPHIGTLAMQARVYLLSPWFYE